MRCLQRQVIPHLDSVLRELPQGRYDTGDLGKDIIGQVADKNFEHHFRRGNGHLAPDIESHVAGRIRQLVKDLVHDPVSFPSYKATTTFHITRSVLTASSTRHIMFLPPHQMPSFLSQMMPSPLPSRMSNINAIHLSKKKSRLVTLRKNTWSCGPEMNNLLRRQPRKRRCLRKNIK